MIQLKPKRSTIYLYGEKKCQPTKKSWITGSHCKHYTGVLIVVQSTSIHVQLRLARSSYRRQYRNLKRGVASNIADTVTTNNCFQKLHKNPKSPAPAMIDKYSRSTQSVMWQKHFKAVFQGENSPYNGNLLGGH